jgi:hypothetical protein
MTTSILGLYINNFGWGDKNCFMNGNGVVDPELLFSDPDPDTTFKEVSTTTPDPAKSSGSDWIRIRSHNTEWKYL